MIIKLSDVILPATDIVGALDVNVPEFMDKMLNEVAPEEDYGDESPGCLAEGDCNMLQELERGKIAGFKKERQNFYYLCC